MRHLWKEWRDHRAVVAGIAVAMPLLLLLARILLPDKWASDPLVAQMSALGTFAIALLAFGTDLVPGETRRGRLAFLGRLPGGLGAAFRAKALFLVLVLVLAPLYGLCVGACFSAWPADGWRDVALWALLLGAAAPWVFAVSCWLPRGALALPATALVFGLFALPLYLLHLGAPEYRPLPVDVTGVLIGLGIGALPVAWFSFTRGYRHGGTFLSAGWRGLAASLLLLVPAYGYGGYRIHEWNSLDPAAPGFEAYNVTVGESGRFLFVDAFMRLRGGRQERPHALVVDTFTGDWRRIGESADAVRGGRGVPARVIAVYEPGTEAEHGSWTRYYDANTGEHFKSGWSLRPPAEVLRRVAAGRLPWQEAHRYSYPLGLGSLIYAKGRWKISDPIRKKVYAYDVRRSRRYPIVLRDGWLVRHPGKDPVLFDPETGAERPYAWPKGDFRHVFRDGRMLFARNRRLHLVDPSTGRGTVVAGVRDASLIRDGVFTVWFEDRVAIARFDDARNGFVVLHVGPARHPVVTADAVFFTDDNGDARRLDRKSGTTTTVFPR